MKALKISISILVLFGLIFFLYRSFDKKEKPGEVDPPDTQPPQLKYINDKISKLQELPDNKFSKDTFNSIVYLIDDNYANGNLGDSALENDQNRSNLSENLYGVYVSKFIKEAEYSLQNKQCEPVELRFIKSESQRLLLSEFLKSGSVVHQKLSTITKFLEDYKKIRDFITDCSLFTFSGGSIKEPFPLGDVVAKVRLSIDYKNKVMRDPYLKNCAKLVHELDKVPFVFFKKHKIFVNSKIDGVESELTRILNSMPTQKLFNDHFSRPLKNDVNALNSTIYNGVSLVSAEIKRLDGRIKSIDEKAYQYYKDK